MTKFNSVLPPAPSVPVKSINQQRHRINADSRARAHLLETIRLYKIDIDVSQFLPSKQRNQPHGAD